MNNHLNTITMNIKPTVKPIIIKIEAFGAIERQLPHDLCFEFEDEIYISDVLEYVTRTYPDASSMLDRCACAVGEDIIPRQTLLSCNTTLVLLAPVAGG